MINRSLWFLILLAGCAPQAADDRQIVELAPDASTAPADLRSTMDLVVRSVADLATAPSADLTEPVEHLDASADLTSSYPPDLRPSGDLLACFPAMSFCSTAGQCCNGSCVAFQGSQACCKGTAGASCSSTADCCGLVVSGGSYSCLANRCCTIGRDSCGVGKFQLWQNCGNGKQLIGSCQ